MGLHRRGKVGPQCFELSHVLTYSGAAARRLRFEDIEDTPRACDVGSGATRIGAGARALALNFRAGARVEEIASMRHRPHRVGRPDGAGKGRIDKSKPPARI